MNENQNDPADSGRGSEDAPSIVAEFDQMSATDAVAVAPKRTRAKSTKTAKSAAELNGAEHENPEVAIAVAEPIVEEVAVEAAPAEETAPKRTRKKAAKVTEAEPVIEAAVEAVAEPIVEAEVAAEIAPVAAAEPKSMAEMVKEKKPKKSKEGVATPVETTATPEVEAPAEVAVSPFGKLGLSPELLQSIQAVGYEEPSPIQEMTIPVLLSGRDVIAQAQTGSGKTAAFGLPIIEAIDPKSRHIQALILCPTRELAIQVAEALHKYGRHKEVETLPIYGGQPYERQFRGLQRGPQIVVGTPGRVMDHMRRQTMNLDHTKFFVLDEADEMLDMGFVEDIEWILQQVPAERQTALFSATMPPRIAQLAATHMNRPERLTVQGSQMTVPETHQVSYEVPRMRKIDALTRILDAETPPISMIFCRTKHGVDELGEALLARGYQAETLHGDLSQAQRDRVMRRFRTGQADILIATDVAARGLDIANVSHVINFDIPESAEAYVHRIGRTGRAGKKGNAITLVTAREIRWLRQIEKTVRARIEPRRLPTAADVAERRVELLKQQILDVMADEASYSYYSAVVNDLAEDHDSSEIAAAILKLYADETGRGAPVEAAVDDIALAMQPMPRPERFERGNERPADRGPRDDSGNVRLFVNIGRNLGVRPQDIVGAIANEAGIPGRSIGAIDIFDGYTFVDVPSGVAERVIDSLIKSGIKGRPVNVEISRPDQAPPRGGDRGPRRDFDRAPGGYDRGPRRDGGGGGYGGGNRDDRGPRPAYNDRDGNVRPAPAGPPSFERRPDDGGAPPRFSGPRDDVPRRYEQRDDRGPRGPRRDY